MKKSLCKMLVFVMMASLLAGCSKGKDIPELMEPLSGNASYRPVVYGDVRDANTYHGVITPKEECYFYNTTVLVDEIKVDVGDYVKEGTVLVSADVEDIDRQIEDLKASMSLKKSIYDKQSMIYKYSLEKLSYQKKACEKVKDKEGIKQVKTAIDVLKENQRYDEIEYRYSNRKMSEQLEKLNELKEESRLVARKSGYVTYVKDLSSSRDVLVAENIVVIADFEQTYVDVPGLLVSDMMYKNSKFSKDSFAYTVINDKKYNLKEQGFSKDELAMAEATGNYPNMRFAVDDCKENLSIGDSIPVYIGQKSTSNVLIIGNDSLYDESDSSFVYVKTESSDMERREVTLGARGTNYTEVLSGLKEGELVYYSSASMTPAKYEPYTVEVSDFTIYQETSSVKDTNTYEYISLASVEGKVKNIKVASGDKVKKGAVIYQISTTEGAAAIKEIENGIKSENQNYNDTLKGMNAQGKEMLSAMKTIIEDKDGKVIKKTMKEQTADEIIITAADYYQKEQLKCDYEILSCEKSIMSLNHDYSIKNLNHQLAALKKENTGNGAINIYAREDMTIRDVYVKEGKDIKLGVADLTYEKPVKEKVMVSVTPGRGAVSANNQELAIASIKQAVHFKCEDGSYVSGVCIGSRRGDGKLYISTINHEVYASSNVTDDGSSAPYFYVEMDEKDMEKALGSSEIIFEKKSYKNAICLPGNMVYEEYDKATGNSYHFVWKIEGESLIKQFVTIDEEAAIESANYVILSGVHAGDVIAAETVSKEEEE